MFGGAAAAVAGGVLVAVMTREPPLPPDAGTIARVRLMTNQQYVNTIANTFGSDLQLGTVIAPLQRTDGLLALSAASVGVTGGQIQDVQRAATSIASQVMDDGDLEKGTPSRRNFLVPCQPSTVTEADDACAEKFIRRAGRLLFRRSLTDDEAARFVGQAREASTQLSDFYSGLKLVLEGMLVNPQVLLIQDSTEPDPDRAGFQRLTAHALASRLSLFLWNAVPDDELLAAAESGELYTRKGRKREVERMLASPRLEQGVRAFFDDMFAFDDFNALSKDAMAYPMVTGATLQDAREQTLRTVVDLLLVKNGDYRDLFVTRNTFVSPALGAVYQVPGVPGWTPYEFPADSEHAGILTHASFLTLHAHPARSSATLRGKALREIFLCQKVPPPPPNVDFSAVEDADEHLRTARERLEVHRTNPSCAGCHKITDPIGLALEKFDGAGQYRDNERGAPIDVAGDLDGKTFSTVAELGNALHDHAGVPSCLVRRVYSYATGGPLKSSRDPVVAMLNERFVDAGYRLKELLRDIALSPAFSRVIEAPAERKKETVVATHSPRQQVADAN